MGSNPPYSYAMPHSDDFSIDDDDAAFLAAATQVEASQNGGGFDPSQRPTKRRRIEPKLGQVDGADGSECSEHGDCDGGTHGLATTSNHFRLVDEPTQASTTAGDEDDERGVDTEYYFPGEIDGEGKNTKNSKYRIHIPTHGGQLPDMLLTQTQVGLDLSPSRIRGAVWKKPKPPPPPPPMFSTPQSRSILAQAARNGAIQRPNGNQMTLTSFRSLASRTARASQVESDEQMAARLQAAEDALSQRRVAARPIAASKPKPAYDQELKDLPSDAFASSSSPEKSPDKAAIIISSSPADSQLRPPGLRGPQIGLKQMTIFGQPATQPISASQAAKKKHAWPLKSREEPPTHHKLDTSAMETWVYPTNLGTIRDYQYNIVSRSLYHNTLVALPTGLGKTFIAATVMLNYYRWTTDAQIVFMAPTKPLIAQQMDACYHIVGISRHDTVLMTGETTPAVRGEEWLEKRVFFMTPQTVINDLKTGICDPKRIVLVVVDEAHKATGSYAYTEVIAFLRRFNASFRVLALTATPGSSVESVQAVIDHLGIARVELRTEQSLDIRQYTHEKHTETEVFDYSDEQALIMEHLSKALKPSLEKLNTQNAYWSRDPMQLTAYGLTTARQKWAASDAGRKAPMPVKGMVNALFTVLSQLGHGIGLLKNHGIGPFYSNVVEFQRNVESGKSKGKTAQQVVQSEDFTRMTSLIRGWTNNPDFIGHPKLQYLREVVMDHFLTAGEGRESGDVPARATRVMVFASYRDSTEEICRVLKRNEPIIRPHVFVGQAASSSSEGMNQKKQNAVIQDFKAGKFNTLVATSIGEEGLDIGDVDLIVCYDASSSPIRMLQRIGRTGRKRIGRVVLLLMRGKEENDYAKAQDNYAYIQKSIADASKYDYRDDQSPRILPKEAHPVVDKRVIDIPIENSQPVDVNEKSRRAKGKGKAKRPPKKFHMPDGVRTGFVKASNLGSDEEDADSVEPAPRKRKTPAKKQNASTKAQKAVRIPEPEAVQLPFLEDVVLNDKQQKQLERRYAHTANADTELFVRAPDAARHPQALQVLGSTKYIRHGKAAETVARAMRAVSGMNDDRVQRMRDTLDKSLITDAGHARYRLVSPEAVKSDSEHDLPVAPARAVKSKPKSRGRPRKKREIQRTTSYGSAAMEGDESEPEPTPANMRIGTQGIDLGSRDTSGEDDDEEPNSELENFIAKSDEVVETVSSSLPAIEEMFSETGVGGRRARGSIKDANRSDQRVVAVDSDDDDIGAGEDSAGESEVTVTNVSTKVGRKRRVVADSDSE